MNVRLAALAAILAISSAGTVAVTEAQARGLRTPSGSDYNLRSVRHRLEGVIDQLQSDQRDYGGHRARAVVDLQQARAEIDAALQYDAGH